MTRRLPPPDDPTSLGAILVAMSAITPEQLVEAVEQQKRSTMEHLLGKILVADGKCTNDQLDLALSVQEAMRCRDKKRQALAVAEIAKCRKKGTNGARQRLIERSAAIIKKGKAHPVITSDMLAKTNSESSR